MATRSFLRILEVLEEHGVEYVVVGGVAAVLQGAPVTTFDIDALVEVSSRNGERLVAALGALDARFREHRMLRPTLTDVMAGGHLLLMTDSGPLDVLGFIAGGKRLEDVAALTQKMRIGAMSVRVLSLEALIAEKRTLGRPKDLVMIEVLEAALRRRRE